MNINYKRKFIILKNKYSNIKGYRPKGHLKLEIKGAHTNINLNIENAEADSSYNLTLISDEIIELGKIYTDSYGRAKSELILRTDDFLQGEIEQGAVIIHRGKEVLLGEYMDKEDGSIEEYIEGQKALELELGEEPEPQIELEPEIERETEPIEPEPEPEPEPESEPELEMGPELVVQPEREPEPQPTEMEAELPSEEDEVWNDQLQVEKEFYEEVIESGDAEGTEFEEDENIDLEQGYNLRKMEQTTNYVLSILRYFPYAEPFKEELHDHNWWLIDYNQEVEEGFLPYFDYIAETNAIELMRKYNHYLFGLFNQDEEVKYYVYAVPGTFTLDEHPNEGLFGFNTWYEGTDEVGYWLLYIDPMTGRVVEPQDPMNPS